MVAFLGPVVVVVVTVDVEFEEDECFLLVALVDPSSFGCKKLLNCAGAPPLLLFDFVVPGRRESAVAVAIAAEEDMRSMLLGVRAKFSDVSKNSPGTFTCAGDY